MGNISVENIIAETKIAESLNIEEVAKNLPDTRYDSSNYPGIVMGVSSNNIAYIILESGKFICAGGKNMREIRRCIGEVVRTLKQKGFNVKRGDRPKITSFTVSTDINGEIDLDKLNEEMDNIRYDPDELPAAVYSEDDKFVALIFRSGKIICTGPGDRKMIENFIKEIVKKIKEVG